MSKINFKLTKKGAIALSVLVILLAGAIYLNIMINRDASNPTDALGSNASPEDSAAPVAANVYSEYFTAFRKERNSIREQEIEYLRAIISERNIDSETVETAQQRLMELVSNMEQEFAIESLIRSKGFLDVAVTFRSGNVNVIIDGESLSDEEVARIQDIVINETGLKAENIRISLNSGGEEK